MKLYPVYIYHAHRPDTYYIKEHNTYLVVSNPNLSHSRAITDWQEIYPQDYEKVTYENHTGLST